MRTGSLADSVLKLGGWTGEKNSAGADGENAAPDSIDSGPKPV